MPFPYWFPILFGAEPATETILLEIDWDNDGVFAHAQSDVTADVLEIPSYFMGRDYASQVYGRSTAGGFTAILRNDAAKYSRFNSSSPIFGKILPNRRVRLKSSTDGGAVSVQWHGYLDSIVPEAREGGANEARLEAFGPLANIQARKSYVAASRTPFPYTFPITFGSSSILTGSAATSVLDSIGFPAADRVIDPGLTTMLRWWVPGLWGAEALRRVEETEFAFVRETRDNEIAFEDRHHRFKGAHLTSQQTYSDASGAALFYTQVPQTDPLQNIVNIIRVKVRRQTVATIATLWTLPENGANSPVIDVGESLTFIAQYPTPNAATQDVGVNVWTDPAATTDYTANSEALGGGTDLTSDVGIATVKATETMEITVTNNGTVNMFLTLLRARGTALQEEHEVWVQFKDTVSIADFDEREYVIPAEFLPDTNQANDYCHYVAALNGQPKAIVAIEYVANSTQDAMTDAHTRNVSDLVTLVANNLTGLGINGPFFVERKEDRIARGGEHIVRLDLSDAAGGFGKVIKLDEGPGLDTGILGF